jgi:hypothetical protein
VTACHSLATGSSGQSSATFAANNGRPSSGALRAAFSASSAAVPASSSVTP